MTLDLSYRVLILFTYALLAQATLKNVLMLSSVFAFWRRPPEGTRETREAQFFPRGSQSISSGETFTSSDSDLQVMS